MNSIEMRNLKFKYPSSLEWVIDIKELSILNGEKVFIYGPSGSGKSTFLEILAGIIIPKEGELAILNQNILKMSSTERDQFRSDRIGYIFQSFNLIPYLSVEENITLPLYLSSKKRNQISETQQNNEVKRICEVLGIEKLLNQPVNEISIGQQQRVAAARAFLGGPEIILADEPTSALDSEHREKFIKLLFKLCLEFKTTVLFVSHDRSLEKYFDRSINLPLICKSGMGPTLETL